MGQRSGVVTIAAIAAVVAVKEESDGRVESWIPALRRLPVASRIAVLSSASITTARATPESRSGGAVKLGDIYNAYITYL